MPPLHLDPGNRHTMIAATTNSGKSYYAGAVIEDIYRTHRKPIAILDTKHLNHAGIARLREFKIVTLKAGKAYNYEKIARIPYLLVRPDPRLKTRATVEHLKEILAAIYDQRTPRAIVVEEAHLYNPSPQIPEDTLELIAREGRAYGQNLILITQRIQDFPKLLWSQCKETSAFRCMIPHDIKYFQAVIPEFDEINATLELHDVVRFFHESGEYEILKAAQIKRITPHLG